MNGLIAPLIFCSNCNSQVHFNGDELVRYFYEEQSECGVCKKKINWWATLTRNVKENFMLNQAFCAIGAKTNIITITLEPNEKKCIHF